jgi:hypothetical protein
MLWIGGLDENFVIALFEHGPHASAVRVFG